MNFTKLTKENGDLFKVCKKLFCVRGNVGPREGGFRMRGGVGGYLDKGDAYSLANSKGLI